MSEPLYARGLSCWVCGNNVSDGDVSYHLYKSSRDDKHIANYTGLTVHAACINTAECKRKRGDVWRAIRVFNRLLVD